MFSICWRLYGSVNWFIIGHDDYMYLSHCEIKRRDKKVRIWLQIFVNHIPRNSLETFCDVATIITVMSYNVRDSVSNLRRLDCLFNRLFSRRSKKSSELRITCLCDGNPPVTGGFPSQRASNAENISIWWCHYDFNLGDVLRLYVVFWNKKQKLGPRTR